MRLPHRLPRNATYTLGFRSDLCLGEWQEDHYAIREILTVTANHESGRRFAYMGPAILLSRQDCEAFIRYISRWLAADPSVRFLDPEGRGAAYWVEIGAVYGSASWSEEIEGAEMRRVDEDAERFPVRYSH